MKIQAVVSSICIIMLLYCGVISLAEKPSYDWHNFSDCITLEDVLQTSAITKIMRMDQYLASVGKRACFDNEVYVIFLKNGIKGVFKPNDDCFAEVAAYRANKFLNLHLVPPTILRTIDGKLGSVQYFVEPCSSLSSDKNGYNKALASVETGQIDAMKMFYFVFGQWDIGMDNQLIYHKADETHHLVLIDNAGMMNRQQIQYGDFAYVRVGYNDERQDDWDEPFPFDHPQLLTDINFEKLQSIFGEFLSESVIKRMAQRYKSLQFCIWRNGLWIQYYKDHPIVTQNYVASCSAQLLDPYKKLSKEVLEEFWYEALQTDAQDHIKELINLTLARAEELCTQINIQS